MTEFEKAMQFVLKWEGGYVNDPTDSGGQTKYGISDRGDGVVDGHADLDGDKIGDVPIKDMTLADALQAYKTRYWDFYKLYNFPSPLCIAMFDAFVQHNPKRVAEWIPKDYSNWKGFNESRRLFYLRLIEKNPSQNRFKRGWMNRLNDLDKLCTIESQEE